MAETKALSLPETTGSPVTKIKQLCLGVSRALGSLFRRSSSLPLLVLVFDLMLVWWLVVLLLSIDVHGVVSQINRSPANDSDNYLQEQRGTRGIERNLIAVRETSNIYPVANNDKSPRIFIGSTPKRLANSNFRPSCLQSVVPSGVRYQIPYE